MNSSWGTFFSGLGSGLVMGLTPPGSVLSTQPASDLALKVSSVAEAVIPKTGAVLKEALVPDCSPADGVRNPFHPVIGRRGGIIGIPNPHIGPNGQVPYNAIVVGPNGRLIGRPVKDPNGNGRVIPHPLNRIPGPRVNPNAYPVRGNPYGKPNF